MSLLGTVQIFAAGGQIVLKATFPVIVGEVVQKDLRHLMASVFVDRVLGSTAVTDEQIVVPVVHA